MTSAEEAGGPKNLFVILFNGNKQAFTVLIGFNPMSDYRLQSDKFYSCIGLGNIDVGNRISATRIFFVAPTYAKERLHSYANLYTCTVFFMLKDILSQLLE
jgi:hypothetical protein